jgi:N-acetylglutamate synthase-like GNAT family acetyltransferase
MTEAANTIDYRVATRDDETDILAVLEEVAPEIPVSLDALDPHDPIRGIIVECRKSGKSWVAVNAHGKVVGVGLARADFHENQAISLRYVGVSGEARRRGIFATLMEKLKSNGVPLTASVLHNNRSGMADRFVKIGFTKVASDAKETKMRWAPVVPMADLQKLVDDLSQLTVLEAADLAKMLEEKWGVSAPV